MAGATGSAGSGQPSPAAERALGIRLAILATLLFSTSAVLVRLASGLGPLEVASYRLILGAGFVAVIAATGRMGLRPTLATVGQAEVAGIDRISPDAAQAPGAPLSDSLFRRFLPILAAGLVAALHFAFYIGALYRTTIAHALVLVNLSPLLAMPLAAVFLGERFDLRRLPGVLVVIAGLAMMVGLEPGLTRVQLGGDLMALLAALAYAVYSLIGRGQRTRTNLLAYTFWVYLVAGVVLLPLAQWQRVMGRVSAAGTALPGLTILAVVLLALLPTAGGHTLYNAALRRADAVTVNLIATQEVTGGVLLGLFFLGEVPSAQAVAGGIVALVGLWLALSSRT